MKPLILYVQETDGRITIDKEMFEKAIQDAYEQGKADAPLTIASPYGWRDIPGIDSTHANPCNYGTVVTCGSSVSGGVAERKLI